MYIYVCIHIIYIYIHNYIYTGDKQLRRFKKRLQLAPHQVLRYEWGGEVLWQSTLGQAKKKISKVLSVWWLYIVHVLKELGVQILW